MLFVWSLLSSDWEEGISNGLLKMITYKWIKICGFHYCSGWIEKYKTNAAKDEGTEKTTIV